MQSVRAINKGSYMNRQATKWFVMVAVLITAGALAALSHAAEANLSLSSAWVRPTLGAGRTTAAYLTITNSGTAADRLVAAEIPHAGSVEIHTAGMEDGIMRMRRLEGLDIAPGATVHLAPGGIHIMVIGLSEPIKSGDEIPLTLTFEEAGSLTIIATVTLAPPAHAPEHMDHQQMDHQQMDEGMQYHGH